MNKLRISKYIFIVIVLGLIVASVVVITKNIKIEEIQESIETINETKEEDYFHGYDISNDYEAFNDRFIENVYGLTSLSDEEKEQLKYYGNNEFEFILKMMQPNQNWNTFPISKEVREELNNEVKEVAKYNFDKVEYSDKTLSDLKEYGSVGQFQVIGTKDKTKIMFTFQISTNYFSIVEFSLLKEQIIQDEEGNAIDTRLICNQENFETIVVDFMDENINFNDVIATTEDFKSKYTTLLDAFVDKFDPKGRYSGINNNNSIDFDNLSADYYWKCNDEEKLYRVKFILDENSYIDDIEISLLD